MQISPISFQSTQPNKTPKNKALSKGEMIALGVTALALTAGTTTLMLSRRPNFIQAFEKAGVTVKDGVAIVKESGEKYTGVIKSRYGKLKLKKETTEFVDGVLKEHLRYNLFGEESSGSFYRNGKLKFETGIVCSGRHKLYSITEYDDQGRLEKIYCRCRIKRKESVFEDVRKMLKKRL